MKDQKKSGENFVKQQHNSKRFTRTPNASEKVSPEKWAASLLKMQGPVEALKVASNYNGDTIGKPPHTEPNPYKHFYTTAYNHIKKLHPEAIKQLQ